MSTFVLVHGAWGSGRYWAPLVPQLEALGHAVVVVEQLPSAGRDPATLGDMPGDAHHVAAIVDEQLDDDVVLVGHSYGGMILTELAAHPAVRHGVYVAAFMTDRGQAPLDVFGDGPPPDWWAPRDDGTAAVSDDVDVVAAALWHDVDPELAAATHADMQLQSLAVFTAASAVPDRTHPATYVVCERDQALPVELQEAMARRADHVVCIDAAHCPMLSVPGQLAVVLDRAISADREVASSR